MQKSIVRNGLIAVLFAFIAILAFMPQKANALSKDYDLGTMNGYEFTIYESIKDGEIVLGDIVVEDGFSYDITDTVLTGRTINFEEAYKGFAAKYLMVTGQEYKSDAVSFLVSVKWKKKGDAEFDKYYLNEEVVFVSVAAQATTPTAVAEDTTFTYDVEAITEEQKWNTKTNVDVSLSIGKEKSATLAENTLTIKKGNTASDTLQALVLAIRLEQSQRRINSYTYENDIAWIIKEVSNSGKYANSKDEYAVINTTNEYIRLAIPEEMQKAKKEEDNFYVVGFDKYENGSEGFVKAFAPVYSEKAKAVYESDYDKDEIAAFLAATKDYFLKLTVLNTKTDAKVATFTHVGVQTGDSNNMVLFVVLFVMAVVAAGAVALKRN